jgi:hypothetical protein
MTGPAAPRPLQHPWLTDDYLQSLIAHEAYHHFEGTRVTVCCIVLHTGYALVESAIWASPATFDPERGRQRAKRKVLDALLEREYYVLRQRLHDADHPH